MHPFRLSKLHSITLVQSKQNVMDDFEILELLCDLYILYIKYKKTRKTRRWWVRPLNLDISSTGYYNTTFLRMKELDSEEFFSQTRMPREVYEMLLQLVQGDLTKKSIREPIHFEARLGLTLSYLSQGVTPKFLSWAFKLGRSTARTIILETCEVIWRVLSPLYVSQPNGQDYKTIANDFGAKWNMPNCVGSIDGKHINIRCPPGSGSSYFNYKKTFSIVLLAACDANCIFTHACVGAYGSQSDGGVLKLSKFGNNLINNKLPLPDDCYLPYSTKLFPHYFVADAAFPLTKNIMRPYPSGPNFDAEQEIFNYRLSRARRTIENAFGILVSRLKILLNTIHMNPDNATKVVLATVALHNFVKLNDSAKKYCPINFLDWEDELYVLHNGEWRQNINMLESARMVSKNASRYAFSLRNELKSYVCNERAVPF